MKKQLPFIAIKNQVIFPNASDLIKVGKKRSLLAIDKAKSATGALKNKLFIAFFKEDTEEILDIDNLYKYGVLVDISSINIKNSVSYIDLTSSQRYEIINIVEEEEDEKININVKDIEEEKNNDSQYDQLLIMRKRILDLIDFAIKKYKYSPDAYKPITDKQYEWIKLELSKQATNVKDLENIFWSTVNHIGVSFELKEKYDLINTISLLDLYEKLANKISEKIRFVDLENTINSTMHGDLEEQQRDFMLREKMRQIRKMLNDNSEAKIKDVESDNEKQKKYPQYVLDAIKSEQARMASMMPSSPEANVSKTYIDLLLELPWRKISKEILDINNVRKILDKHHYGLEKPKERILEFISVLTHTKNKNSEETYLPIKGDKECFLDTKLFINKLGSSTNEAVNNIPILTLIGPPGVGKTTLAKSIAEALNRKFIKVSLGGVKDEAEIRGHRRTYVGAMPGKIINAIKKAGVSNPVILLDEIDKMSADFRGDPVSAMLEVLDPEQNANFQDHYLDLEYDLSKVLFIATANYYDSIPAPLIDRVEILELSTYTTIEKIQIAKNYLMPKIYEQNKLEKSQFKIDDKTIEFIIRNYTRESGVRELKRLLDSIARKIVVRILDGKIKKEFQVNIEVVKEFLGPIKFGEDENENIAQIGVVNGLAYTSYGGSTLAIEVTTFPGKEGLKLTGSLKDVMKESAQIALAYVRHNAKKFDIDFDFDNNSIHIHVPEGAVPKDGPSAGVTFTTSIISALSHKPVPANIGMTGEITLRGKVLPIGGLKEKSLAASQFGIKKIFIPFDNQRHLIDVPEEVKKEVEYVPVKYYDEIYNQIFLNNNSVEKEKNIKSKNKAK